MQKNIFKKELSIVFCGSGTFAVPILQSLINNDFFNIKAVVTNPDKKAGRKQIFTPTKVKQFLNKNNQNITIFQPVSIKNSWTNLDLINTDLLIVADYGQILPLEMLNAPKYGSINVHASLLPKYRGAVPIQASILAGEKVTGVSIMKMDAGLDTGPVLTQKSLPILDSDNSISLEHKLALLGAELLPQTIFEYINKKIKPINQNNKLATITSKEDISKEKAQITKNMSAKEIDLLIRAMNPWPIAWLKIKYNNKELKLKVFKAELIAIKESSIYTFFKKNKELYLQLNGFAILLKEVQLPGLKKMEGKNYLFLANKANF